MNKAAVYDRYGAPGALELRDLPMSPLQAGELLVKVVAAAVNPVDWKIMRGDFRLVSGRRFPRLIGADFSGTVATVGAGVADYAVGDAVFGTINPLSGKRGCLAEFIVVQPAEIVRKPENVSFADAATLPIAGVSALDCLDRLGQAQRGQRLLVTGAAGGVGAFIVQLAKLNGLHVTGVCRECNGEWVRGLGADTIIAHDRAKVFTGDARYDLIIDAAAVHTFGQCRDWLTPRGIYVNTMPGPRLFFDVLRTRFFSCRQARVLMAQVKRPRLELLAAMMADQRLRSIVVERFPFSEVRRAYELSATGHARGKIVVELNSRDQD